MARRILLLVYWLSCTSAWAVTFTVTQTGDESDCSPGDGFCNTGNPCQPGHFNCTLRAAIEEANARATNDLVSIVIQTFTANETTIALTQSLPPITHRVSISRDFGSGPVIIDGGGSDGFVFQGGNGGGVSDLTIQHCANGVVFQGGSNYTTTATLLHNGDGVLIDGSHFNTVGGVISGNSGDGVHIINGSKSNIIYGARIGTTADGAGEFGNGGNGVHIVGSPFNTISYLTVISGNAANGVFIEGAAAVKNEVRGCYIGTDVDAATAIPNAQNGVLISGAPSNFVGFAVVSATYEHSVISGNGGDGVKITGAGAHANDVNLANIGTDLTGLNPIGNTGNGVVFENGANGNSFEFRNYPSPGISAFNGGAGVLVSSATSNEIAGMSIHDNGGLGIQLNNGNGTPNAPALSGASAFGGQTQIAGTLSGKPNTSYTIDYYANTACDGSGSGEGEEWLDLATRTTDAAGNADIGTTIFAALPAGTFITATATEFLKGLTSEFSPCITVGGALPCSITCPGSVTNTVEKNRMAKVSYPMPITSGPCGTITCTPPSGSTFPLGSTRVDCTASASFKKCHFFVVVVNADYSASVNVGAFTCTPPSPTTNCVANGTLSFLNRGNVFAAADFMFAKTCKTARSGDLKCKVAGTLTVTAVDFDDTPPCVVSFYLSDDATLGPMDALLYRRQVTKLEASFAKGVPLPVKFRIPKGVNPTGKFILIAMDDLNKVPESDETNNNTSFGPLP